jgi:Tfp pilus assembly protein PilX
MVPNAPLASSNAVDEEMKQDSAATAIVREEEVEFQTPTKAKPQRSKRKLATSTGLEQQPPDAVFTANSFASLDDDPPRTPLRTSSLSTLPSPARRQSSSAAAAAASGRIDDPGESRKKRNKGTLAAAAAAGSAAAASSPPLDN